MTLVFALRADFRTRQGTLTDEGGVESALIVETRLPMWERRLLEQHGMVWRRQSLA